MFNFWSRCSWLVLGGLAACSSGESSEGSPEVETVQSNVQEEGAEQASDESVVTESNPAGVAPIDDSPAEVTGISENGATPMTLGANEPETSGADDGVGDGGEEEDTGEQGEPEPSADEIVFAPAAVCGAGPFADSPILAGVEPQVECDGMVFTEGAVWFSELNTLFFSDINSNPSVINSFSPGGACETFIENAGTNGLAISTDGNLLSSRHGSQNLTVFNLETKEPTVLVADNQGVAFNSPNDVVLRSDGNLYFTDPNYGLGGQGVGPQPTRAYWRDTEGVLTVIDEGGNANGINLSPDETRLYLSHLGGGNDVLVYDVDAAGSPSNPTTFLNSGSDGMVVDCAGNLYVTNNGVQIYNPQGEQIGSLNTPGAANVAFGGPNRTTLYVTARGTLFSVEMAIPGMPY